MRSSRIAVILAFLTTISFSLSVVGRSAPKSGSPALSNLSYPPQVAAYHGAEPIGETQRVNDQGSGIKEEIPQKYAARYAEWKKEFLSTEAGLSQWAAYQNDAHFTLTITLSPDN